MIEACIFDLDGVVVDTAKYHFIAWRRLANELGFDFTEKENEKLKGVSRMGSLDLILSWGGVELSDEEKNSWAETKNNWYREYILQMQTDEILEGVLAFFDELDQRGIPFALGSASKNASTILHQIGIADRFNTIVDGTKFTKSKPDPEVFELGAAAMNVKPANCIVFEDAPKGVEAALNGGFWAVGVGTPENLGHAHHVIPGFGNIKFDSILDYINTISIHQ